MDQFRLLADRVAQEPPPAPAPDLRAEPQATVPGELLGPDAATKPLTDREDYLNSIGNNVGCVLSAERLFGIEITERCKVLRVIAAFRFASESMRNCPDTTTLSPAWTPLRISVWPLLSTPVSTSTTRSSRLTTFASAPISAPPTASSTPSGARP